MKRILLLACLSFFFCGQILAQAYPYCIANRFSEQPTFNNVVVVSDYEVEYGFSDNWQLGQDTLRLDIHYPNKTIDPLAKRPLVVLIHGGDYLTGNKSYYTDYCMQLAERGFVAMTIDYRKGWQHTMNDYCNSAAGNTYYEAMYRSVQDAKAAIRYVLDKSAFYKIDEDYVFVGGNDVGAITALQVAFLEDSEVLSIYPTAVTTMGGINVGTNPIIKPFTIKGVLNWGGGVLAKDMLDITEQIPVLSMHGEADNVVSIDSSRLYNCTSTDFPFVYGSRALYDYMSGVGICNTANYRTSGMQDVFMNQDRAYTLSKSACFMKEVLCGNCNKVEQWDINPVLCSDSKPLIASGLKHFNKVLVSPNPADGMLSIELNEAGVTASLYSIYGQKVLVQKLQSTRSSIDVSSLNRGVYFLELSLENERVLRKVLLE